MKKNSKVEKCRTWPGNYQKSFKCRIEIIKMTDEIRLQIIFMNRAERQLQESGLGDFVRCAVQGVV